MFRSLEEEEEEEDDERYPEYSSQARKKEIVQVALQMPQLPLPYGDDHKVNNDNVITFLNMSDMILF